MLAKYQNVFRSRWKALSWAAGILLTAYCSVPSREETAQDDAAKVQAEVPAPQHVNPWALDPKKK